jgi:F0F1-type ATP synthase assembly protein I
MPPCGGRRRYRSLQRCASEPASTTVVASGIDPVTARSQLIGGITMGLSMAFLEESIMDAQFGDYANHDLVGYYVAANADVQSIEIGWVTDHDEHLNPSGVKGLGEIGICGTAAAIANAVWHATGVRHRDRPIRPDRVLMSARARPVSAVTHRTRRRTGIVARREHPLVQNGPTDRVGTRPTCALACNRARR